ncbi:hypothetical protein [Saccharopolyspora gloriosae]|uniref:hypothetical protein n=1 Tax=Saccharopolyspora gloriosae TaxID=455344 RepID=UPI001FB78DE2|nr:hypothetical protein [Saccharopolyspora gloriosae]
MSKCLDNRDYRGAVELFGSLRPSDRELAALLECARTLQRPTRLARPRFEALEKRAAEAQDVRAVVAACAPVEWDQHRPAPVMQSAEQRAPRWTDDNRHEAPRDITTRRTLRRLPNPASEEAAQRAHNLLEAYAATRLNVDDDAPARPVQADAVSVRPDSPTVYASGLDYDDAAKHPARGRCLVCNVEPSEVDRRQRDGLCEECRERGHPGLEPLPANASRADRIRAVCAYRAAQDPHPLRALRAEWVRYSRDEDRRIVEDWVSRNTPTAPVVKLPAPRRAADNVRDRARVAA